MDSGQLVKQYLQNGAEQDLSDLLVETLKENEYKLG